MCRACVELRVEVISPLLCLVTDFLDVDLTRFDEKIIMKKEWNPNHGRIDLFIDLLKNGVHTSAEFRTYER